MLHTIASLLALTVITVAAPSALASPSKTPHGAKQPTTHTADPDVEAAKQVLKLAKARAKSIKAIAAAQKSMLKIHAAIEKCEKALGDLCVAEGKSSCEDKDIDFRPCQGPADRD